MITEARLFCLEVQLSSRVFHHTEPVIGDWTMQMKVLRFGVRSWLNQRICTHLGLHMFFDWAEATPIQLNSTSSDQLNGNWTHETRAKISFSRLFVWSEASVAEHCCRGLLPEIYGTCEHFGSMSFHDLPCWGWLDGNKRGACLEWCFLASMVQWLGKPIKSCVLLRLDSVFFL